MKHIQAKRVGEGRFERYGSVAAMSGEEPIARGDAFAFWSDVAHFDAGAAVEIGYCTVYRRPEDVVDWMERHDRSSEVLVPIDGSFVLPVMSAEGDVEAFHVDRGEAVVIGQSVWHSACKPAEGLETTYFVLFRRGTPQEDVIKRDIEPVVIDRA